MKNTKDAKSSAKKETGKRLSNEQLMDKLVAEGATDAKIKKQFTQRYEGQTVEYVAKRIKIYRSISDRRLGTVEQKSSTKKTEVKKTAAKKTSVKKSTAKKPPVEEKTAVNA